MEATPPTPRPPPTTSPADPTPPTLPTPPTPPTADRPAPAAGGRRRAALVLLVLALVVPMVANFAGPLAAAGDPLVVLGAVAVAAAALALAAAVVAPVRFGPRVAVVAAALANGAGGLWLMTIVGPTRFGFATLASAATGPLELPALAWLGAALATGLTSEVRRSWRASLLLAAAVAGLQVLLSVVAVGTYGAAFRFAGGVEAYVLLGNSLSGAATVGMLHVLVSAVRTWRALDGHRLPALRPWLLVAAVCAAVLLSAVGVLVSGVL